MAKFKVAERFVSINGESVKAGELAVFYSFYRLQSELQLL